MESSSSLARLRCLACRCDLAVETALREAESDGRLRTEAAVRWDGLIRFELRRDRTRTDAEIAKPIGVTPNRVRMVRAELGLPSPRRRPKPRPAVERRCVECGAKFVSSNARRFCSGTCRQRAHRRRVAG